MVGMLGVEGSLMSRQRMLGEPSTILVTKPSPVWCGGVCSCYCIIEVIIRSVFALAIVDSHSYGTFTKNAFT